MNAVEKINNAVALPERVVFRLSDCTENSNAYGGWNASRKKQGFKKVWAKDGIVFFQAEGKEKQRLERTIIGSVPVSKFPTGSPVNLLTGFKTIFGKKMQITDRIWPKEKFKPVLPHLNTDISEDAVLLSTFTDNGTVMICAEGKIDRIVAK